MTKDITDKLEALHTAGLAVIALVKVHKGLITLEDAHRQLQELGFTSDETKWIQEEVDKTFNKEED